MCTLSLVHDGFHVFAGGASLIAHNKLLTLASGVRHYREAAAEDGADNALDLREQDYDDEENIECAKKTKTRTRCDVILGNNFIFMQPNL